MSAFTELLDETRALAGIRFYRDDFEVVYDLKDGKITGVTVEGLHFTLDKEAAR